MSYLRCLGGFSRDVRNAWPGGGAQAVGPRSLREIFCQRGIRLVFLNACETGRDSYKNANAGAAPSLIAGGVPAVMKELLAAGKLHGNVRTVTGRTLAEDLAEVPDGDREVIRSYANPMLEAAGYVVMSGNLFDSAVMKISVIDKEFRKRFLSDPDRINDDGLARRHLVAGRFDPAYPDAGGLDAKTRGAETDRSQSHGAGRPRWPAQLECRNDGGNSLLRGLCQRACKGAPHGIADARYRGKLRKTAADGGTRCIAPRRDAHAGLNNVNPMRERPPSAGR